MFRSGDLIQKLGPRRPSRRFLAAVLTLFGAVCSGSMERDREEFALGSSESGLVGL